MDLLRLALPALALSCGPPMAAPNSPRTELVATNLAPPAGAVLAQACTPTGPELCFNAIDDNCNGVIDEGCGEDTGLLQFTIAWAASAADVNLVVITPSRDRVPNGAASASGFRSGRDCPGAEGCGGQNVEDVFFDGADPPRGTYGVEIVLVDLHGEEAPVGVHFGARIGQKTMGFDVQLAPGDAAKKTFAFDLP